MPTFFTDDFEIIDDKDQYASFCCTVCSYFMLHPVVLGCGHTFCESCTNVITNGSAPMRKCPMCRQVIVGSRFPPNLDIKSLAAKIPAKCSLCMWTGTVGAIQSHKAVCAKRVVKCPNIGCGEISKREDMPAHARVCFHRLESCPKCGERIPVQRIPGHLMEACKCREVLCPHYRSADEVHVLMRCELMAHLESCPGRMLSCSIPGCAFIGTFEELARHMSTNTSHVSLVRGQFIKLVDLLSSQKSCKNVLSQLKEHTAFDLQITWRLNGCKNEVSRSIAMKTPLTSGMFNGGRTKWRLVLFPWLNTLGAQLRSSHATLRGSITYFHQTDHTEEKKLNQINEGDMAVFKGVQVDDDMVIVVRVKIIEPYL